MRASTLVLICIAMAGAAATLWLGMQLSEERARSGELSAELQALRHRAGERPMAPAPASTPSAARASQASLASAAAPVPGTLAQVEMASDEPPAGRRGRDSNDTQRRLLGNPEYRKAMRAQQRLNIEQRYRDLPRALGLSPEQADQVFDLLAEQSMGAIETGLRIMGKEDVEAKVRANVDRQRAYETRMAELIGESNLAKLQDFRESMQSRAEVRMLGNELIGTSDPLREDQMEPLLAVMYTEQKRLQQEWSDVALSNPGKDFASMGAKRSQLAIAANQRIIDASRSLLSSKQLAALEDLYRRQKQQMESQDTMNGLMMQATGSSYAPKPMPGSRSN